MSAPEFKKTKAEFLQDIINDYRELHPDEQDWVMTDIAAWAIRNNKWYPPRRNAIRLCASELAQAARVEYEEDPQGRRVRTKHARRESRLVDGKWKQYVFWEDIKNASPKHMRVSLQQRRGAVLNDCAQLKRDTDSYNENNPSGAQIPMSYDFTEDLFELEAPEEYPDADDQQDDGEDPSTTNDED